MRSLEVRRWTHPQAGRLSGKGADAAVRKMYSLRAIECTHKLGTGLSPSHATIIPLPSWQHNHFIRIAKPPARRIVNLALIHEQK